MVEPLMFGHKSLQTLIDVQIQMAAEVGKPKRVVPTFPVDAVLAKQMYDQYGPELNAIMDAPFIKANMYDSNDALQEKRGRAHV